MKLEMAPEMRRMIALTIVGQLRGAAPTPADLAALCVEIGEIGRESISSLVDCHPEMGTRQELANLLDGVQVESQAAALETSRRLSDTKAAARGGVS